MTIAGDTDLAEQNRLLRQDVIALRHALERAQQEKAEMLRMVNEFRFKHEQTIRRLNATIEEFLK